eukprot:4899012-Pyramimonas_sp.AAC.1
MSEDEAPRRGRRPAGNPGARGVGVSALGGKMVFARPPAHVQLAAKPGAANRRSRAIGQQAEEGLESDELFEVFGARKHIRSM